MSDLYKLRQKATEGKAWRGSINVQVDGDDLELAVRQLTDPEFYEVMSLIDIDEVSGDAMADMPDDELERYNELVMADELSDEEAEEMAELEELLADSSGNMFQEISQDTFEGILLCAEYAVEPTDEDLMAFFDDHEWLSQIEDEHGVTIKTPDDCHEYVKSDLQDIIRNLTDFSSFNIGIQALIETIDDTENLSN